MRDALSFSRSTSTKYDIKKNKNDRCKSLSVQNLAELHIVCSLVWCKVNSAM